MSSVGSDPEGWPSCIKVSTDLGAKSMPDGPPLTMSDHNFETEEEKFFMSFFDETSSASDQASENFVLKILYFCKICKQC